MLYLSPHIYCRESDDGAILLDLHCGDYLGINAEDLSGLKGHIANWPTSACDRSREVKRAINATQAVSPPTDQLIANLMERRILTTFTSTAKSDCPTLPLRSVTTTGRAMSRRRVTLKHGLQLTLALLHVRFRTRHGRLEPLLKWLGRRQRHLGGLAASDTGDLEVLLFSHCRWRIWFYTAHNHCLLDSLVLSVFLVNNRVPGAFVIGIATKPFVAHAWVQMGDYVLNETAEYVQMFSPILAVGDYVE